MLLENETDREPQWSALHEGTLIQLAEVPEADAEQRAKVVLLRT
jgi:hypothetical protein